MVLVANKIDLDSARVVSSDEGRQLASKLRVSVKPVADYVRTCRLDNVIYGLTTCRYLTSRPAPKTLPLTSTSRSQNWCG